MPRPNAVTAPVGDESDEQVNGAAVNGEGVVDSGKPKRQYNKREIALPDGVNTGYSEALIEETPPPARKRGGRGRGPSPVIPKIIEQLTSNPDKWFYIGNFRSAASPEGPWKDAGITFRHGPFVGEDGNQVEGLFKRYACHQTQA